MDRAIKLAAALALGVSLVACSSTGDGYSNQVASCKGGYPDGGGISDMSPYSPNAGSFQPDCDSNS